MKQVSKKEKKFLENLGLIPLLLYVCAEDLSNFKWKNININWENDKHEKVAILRDKTNILWLKTQEKISYIYLLVAADSKEYLPKEEIIENLIAKLEIESILVWRNEFLFNKEKKEEILELITNFTLCGAHIVLIQKKLQEFGLNRKEMENIFAMHPLYANTDLFLCAYPERSVFIDIKKIRSFESVKSDWLVSRKI